MTIMLADADGGTDIVAVHDRLPPGLSPADNETGWRMSLDKLATLVEGDHDRPTRGLVSRRPPERAPRPGPAVRGCRRLPSAGFDVCRLPVAVCRYDAPKESTMRAGLFAASAVAIATLSGPALAQRPTTQKIVMTRVFPQPGQIGLFLAAADGSRERPLFTPASTDYNPAWAPDGKSIAFTSERNGSADIFRARPDGTGLERLTDSTAFDDQAAFSPDGKQLVFVSTRASGNADLWTMDLQTRRAKTLTLGEGGDFRPAWSPDGQWIAFSSDRESNMPFAHGRWEHLHLVDLYIVHPDGTGLKRLTPHGEFCGSPRWSADSLEIVADCMTAEQTLDNRRATPEHPEDTRIVAVDIKTSAMVDLPVGRRREAEPVAAGR